MKEAGKEIKPVSRLHTLNMVIAALAGIISIVGGIYSLKVNFLSPKPVFGEVAGFVRDEKLGKPLRMATVEITDAGGAVINSLSTDNEGHYVLKELKEGNYEIKAEAVLHIVQKKKISIQGDKASSVDFNLIPIEGQEFLPDLPAASPPRTIPTANVSSAGASQPFGNSYPAQNVPTPVSYGGPGSLPASGGPAYESQREMYSRSRYPNRRVNSSGVSSGGSSGNMNILLQAGTELVGQMLNENRKTQTVTSGNSSSQDSSQQGQN
ncbi:MAG TPA: carboxypeptidase-like regulatory domain-containing protein [Candidatus Omnitrophota bacterium]|nr:carboxypeptidase-like regulatory domain-containing protein [Candidatus Omnitrophota bacterium]